MPRASKSRWIFPNQSSDRQVQVPATAAERKGSQPIVTVQANGGARTEIPVGQPVSFSATTEAPPQYRASGFCGMAFRPSSNSVAQPVGKQESR